MNHIHQIQIKDDRYENDSLVYAFFTKEWVLEFQEEEESVFSINILAGNLGEMANNETMFLNTRNPFSSKSLANLKEIYCVIERFQKEKNCEFIIETIETRKAKIYSQFFNKKGWNTKIETVVGCSTISIRKL